jgi:predicted RNA-binding protein YlqC (UPF0109 family)
VKKKPQGEQVEFLRGIIEHNVKAIVEHEDDVKVQASVTPGRVVFTVLVHHEDMGLVIGERGATGDAIRRIVWTACKKTDKRADIDFI